MKLIRLLKKRGKSGFTLVEVIVSCVLLGILILGVFSVVTPIISGVKSREQNANALMLAEAAEAYIDRSIKNSIYVVIFENAKPDDMKEGATIPESEQMKEMVSFINGPENKDAAGNEVFELKCIAVRWGEDKKSQRYKYMITSETVDKEKGIVDTAPTTSKSYNVFETCFYENLFPIFNFEIMKADVIDDEGNPVTDPATGDVLQQEIPAIKTTIDVYRDSELQELAFKGTGYADLTNIKRQSKNGSYKLFSKDGIKDADGNIVDGSSTVLREADSFGEDEHPETYIYFITRKLKAITPTTPSSTSTPSSTPSSST